MKAKDIPTLTARVDNLGAIAQELAALTVAAGEGRKAITLFGESHDELAQRFIEYKFLDVLNGTVKNPNRFLPRIALQPVALSFCGAPFA